MIKVNLKNAAVCNQLTRENMLESVFVDGNSLLFVTKPEYLKQMFRDEIRAKQIKLNLELVRQKIHERMRDPKFSNFDDMETLKAFRAKTAEYQETEAEYKKLLSECENVKQVPVYSGNKLDLVTGEMTEVKQAEYKDYTEVDGNRARLVLDVLALDDEKLDRDSAWLRAKGCEIRISTTPGAPLAITGGTLEEAVAAVL